ncbi:hypothetical protein ABFB09_01190 [Dehalogenimonas sp. THU2]|uniref:hypothetical protein n=1 Tax=Dehalogenimonas sp. THU2 TaxID=3151121 RepID=UPI00321871ED
MIKKTPRSVIILVLTAILLMASSCGPAAEGNTNTGNVPPATTPPATTPPVTTTPATTPPAPTTTPPVVTSNFMCELKEYPATVWPLFNVQDRQNNFWMEVYYPADFVYPDVTFYYGVQYGAKGTEAEVIKHYHDLVEAHQINAFSDVQGTIGKWEVHANVESSFYTGEQVVSVMVGNNTIKYESNPLFTDFPTASFPAFQQSAPMSDLFHCWSTNIEYQRRYKNNGTATDALNHYRNLMSGATGFTENAVTDSYGTTTTLKGNLVGYTVEIAIRTSNNTITVKLEKPHS